MSRVLKYLLPLLTLCVATATYGQKYPERHHVRKGNSLYEEQRMEEAQKEYRTALQKDAASVEGKFNLGDSQYAMGDFESAENTFHELSEYPNLADDVKAMISKGRYELLMEVKDDGDNVNIYTVGSEKTIESFVFLCRSGNDVQFICIDGAMDRKEVETLIAKAAASSM